MVLSYRAVEVLGDVAQSPAGIFWYLIFWGGWLVEIEDVKPPKKMQLSDLENLRCCSSLSWDKVSPFAVKRGMDFIVSLKIRCRVWMILQGAPRI